MAAAVLNINKHRWFFAAAFLLLVAIQVQVLRSIGLAWQTALWDSSITNIILGGACTLMTNALRFYIPRKHQYAILTIWSLTLSAVVSLLVHWALKNILHL